MKKTFLYILLMVITSTVFGQNVYVVTKTTDPNPFTDKFNNDDALCDPDMYGTLQWAINKVNYNGGESRIEFNIPGTGVHEISSNSYFPQIKNPVVIDGTTQAGYTTGSPVVKITGQMKTQYGFNVYNTTVTIKGLEISNFARSAIMLNECSNSKIIDNKIYNISFSGGYGLHILACNYTEIYGNRIEIDALPEYGRSSVGIYIDKCSYCTIGGTETGKANIIANCQKVGVVINSDKYNKVSGNSIYNNPKAIQLGSTANDNIQPPVITSYANGILSGTALPNSTVEVFGSTGAENANEYLVSVVADEHGEWSVEVNTGYDYFAVTQRDLNDNTSQLVWFEFEKSCNYPIAAIDVNGNHITIETEPWTIDGNPFDFTALHLTMCENTSPFYIYDENSAQSVSAGFEPIGTPVFWYGDCGTWAYSDWDGYEYNSCVYWDEESEIEPFWHDQYGYTIQFDPSEYGVGEHTINLQYGTICFISKVFITVLPTPDATITPVEPICENAHNLTLTAATTGGVWSGNGITNSTAGTFNPTDAGVGTHQIIYSIFDDCPASDTIFIEVVPMPDITASNSGPVCEGFPVNFTSSSTIEDLTYHWFSGSTGYVINNPNNSGFTIPAAQVSHAGDYMVTVTDLNGCTNEAETTLEVHPNPIVNITPDPAVVCNNDPITLEAGEFVSFLWSTGSQEQFLTVTEGNTFYSVTVVDQYECEGIDTIFVGESNIEIALLGSQGSCGNENAGSITIQASGGTAPYAYEWTGPGSFNASTPSINNLYPGDYSVIVTNQEHCTTSATYTVDALTVPQLAITDDIICTGTNDGVLSVTVTNMSGPFDYEWSGGQNTSFIYNQVAGDYSVTVTALNTCSATISTQITNHPVPDVTITPQNPVVCNQEPLTLDAGEWETYHWNAGATTQQITTTNHDTDFSVTITDINGCDGYASIHTNGSNMTIKDTIIVHTCEGQNTGSIDITVIGGDPTISYDWDGPGGFAANTEDISNLFAGIYSVEITDDNDCQLFGVFEVLAGENPVLEATGGHVCNGAATGEAEVVVINPPGTYTYIWNTGANTPVITDLVPGYYSVTVINDLTGCSAEAHATIEDYIVNAEFSLNDNCLDLDRIAIAWYYNYHFDFEYDVIDWQNYDFYWDLGNGTTSTATSVPVDYTLDGYYCVSATVRREECISTSSETVYVYPDRCFCAGEQGEQGFGVFYNDYIVNSAGENWTGLERKIRGQIVVPSGVTLYIHKCLLRFAPNGGITVEQGGNLIVSQTKMTSMGMAGCNGMWSGIEVHGQWGLTTAQQGKVQFINGGNIIENAHIGVLLGERNVDYVCNPHINPELGPFNTAGSCGWIKADDVEFVNNGTDIRFVKPIGNYQYNNPSAVKNCYFTSDVLLDECYRNAHPSRYGNSVSTTGLPIPANTRNPWAGGSNETQRSPQGIWMQKHRFNNNFDLITLMNKEICVETYDSRYDVTRSHFEKSIYGLRIYNTLNTANNAHRIYNNTFDKIPGIADTTGAHIYIQGGILDRVKDNTFGFPLSIQDLSSTGIYATGASRFVIEENDFNRLKTGVFVGNSGTNSSDVRAGDSNVHDDWRGNNFYQCKTNIYTRGHNPRLRLRCNNCKNDNPSPTMHEVNFLNQGVLANQGTFSSSTPQQIWGAGNEFTDANVINPSPSSRYIKSNYAYRYVYHSDVKTTPVIYPGSVLNPQPLGLAKAVNTVACPVLSISFALPLNGIPAIEEILPIRPDILNEIDYLEQLRTNLKNNEDGGKTQQLLDDINNHIPNGQLKNKLIANSPLSDTVITALLIEYPLSHGNFKNVMEINMPVSPTVEPYLFARLETLPQGIRQQLKPLQSFNSNVNTVSSTTRYIDYLTQERELLVNEILMIFTDTAYYNPEYIKQILAAENNPQFDMNLAAFLIDEGNYLDAIQIINDIEPVNKETSDWIDYHQILLSLFNNNKTIYQMDSTQLALITDLAYTCPSNYTTANAQAVLHLLYGTEFEECEEMINRRSFSLIKDVVFTVPETNAWVEDNFPNPFTDETLINYYLPEESTGSIVVTDMYGREIAFFNLASGENTLIVKSDAWAPGVYSYSFIVDGKSLEHKKMIITQ